MQYTKYFSFLIKENGQPNMSPDSFRTIMNIVYLEGVISGLNKSKEASKDTDLYHRFDVSIFREQRKLADITGNISPSDYMNRLLAEYL